MTPAEKYRQLSDQRDKWPKDSVEYAKLTKAMDDAAAALVGGGPKKKTATKKPAAKKPAAKKTAAKKK